MTLLSMTRGDTQPFTVTLLDSDGSELDLTSVGLTFTAKLRYSDADEDAVFQKTIGDGIVLDADPTTGIATVTIEPADTDAVTSRSLHWDIQVEDNGDVRTPLAGRLWITPDVTRTVTGS